MDKAPQPYVDPNFGEPSKWVVDVQMKEWQDVPSRQKKMMIREKLMNARTVEDRNLAYNINKNEDNLKNTNNNNGYKSGNKGMR